jgi:hypothetical protein
MADNLFANSDWLRGDNNKISPGDVEALIIYIGLFLFRPYSDVFKFTAMLICTNLSSHLANSVL